MSTAFTAISILVYLPELGVMAKAGYHHTGAPSYGLRCSCSPAASSCIAACPSLAVTRHLMSLSNLLSGLGLQTFLQRRRYMLEGR